MKWRFKKTYVAVSLAIGFGVSLALHSSLLAVSFVAPPSAPVTGDRLKIVLVNSHSSQKPEQANIFAQNNLDGGGTGIAAAEPISTPLPSEGQSDFTQEEMQAEDESVALLSPNAELLSTPKGIQAHKNAPAESTEKIQLEQSHSGLDTHNQTQAIAGVRGVLSEETIIQSADIRRVVVGARTASKADSLYLNQWEKGIARYLTQNYPEKSLYGVLQLAVVIDASGKVIGVRLLQSSGIERLDLAALRLAQKAGPFKPVPSAMMQGKPYLEIVRDYHFTRSDKLKRK